MINAINKQTVLYAYQMLDGLFNENFEECIEFTERFGIWCTEVSSIFQNLSSFSELIKVLLPLFTKAIEKEAITNREMNSLKTPLNNFINELTKNIHFVLYVKQDVNFQETVTIKNDFHSVEVLSNSSTVTAPNENSIQILVVKDEIQSNDEIDKFDMIFKIQDVVNRAQKCFTIDTHDYDRVYLSSKFSQLTKKKITTVFSGSSYAMVGFKEELMKEPAINLAVNAQDPYYTFKSCVKATEHCDSIQTIVIAGGYYFWHTEMSDNPSSYYKSLLSRVNYPVFQDLHNYEGELLPPFNRSNQDCLLEKIFDFEFVNHKNLENIFNYLTERSYYNESNKRPANGMLQYSFISQSDEVNQKAAQFRANGHNGNFSLVHLEQNMDEFSNFLEKMNRKNIRVVVVIPPVTTFYQPHILAEMKSTCLNKLESLKKEKNFTLIDLTYSGEFENSDFQDYDHLNALGAEKLTNYIANYI